ncbi:hypothetical protein [Roseimarinus sediminis]|uniref:hypothetical protein n=1 Tax=Roseimarinus sediminis TaxID=1610899 RepID=UPI003D195CE6
MKNTPGRLIRNLFLLFIGLTLLRLVSGCIFRCSCPETEVVDITYNKALISGIDNSDGYTWYHQLADSIPAGAIGFNIVLCDSNYFENPAYYFVQNKAYFQPFIKGAYAMQECICNQYDFKAEDGIRTLSISTRYDFSDDYPAGSDLTHLLVALVPNYPVDLQGMYLSFDELLEWLQKLDVLDLPETEMDLFLKEAPTNDSLQLVFSFEFDDASCLAASSPVIYPIN